MHTLVSETPASETTYRVRYPLSRQSIWVRVARISLSGPILGLFTLGHGMCGLYGVFTGRL